MSLTAQIQIIITHQSILKISLKVMKDQLHLN